MSNNIHTMFHQKNKIWLNKEAGTLKLLSTHETKREAVQKGYAFALTNKSVHVIHSMDGSIAAKNSYGNNTI